MSRATVGLLFSDIEGSTRLLQQLGPAYGDVLIEHRRVLRAAFEQYGGQERGTEGDSFFITFATAADAVSAALAGQRAIAAVDWPHAGGLKVRMGVHIGAVDLIADTVVGLAVHEAARIAAAAHGGQVLASEPAAAMAEPLPRDASWLDLGRHRLKDLPEPVPLLQLAHPDLAAEFPAPRTQGGGRNNLPAQPTTFIGRDEELAAIDALFSSSRLVTITGTGGVGKSRIALRVAAGQGDRHPDGVWFVDLSQISDPAAVDTEVAVTLSLGDVQGEALIQQLRTQRLLVVLDNCEHLLDGVGAFVERVLRQCPDVSVLATSREPIGLAGESVWRVPPLRVVDAMQLLSVRAQAVSSAFAISPENEAAVREVCERLDAIPLALELAAARLGSLTVQQLSSRLDQRFRLLSGGGRGALGRHRTLQATVDWSYGLLDPDERAVLRRVGVFAGGFDLDAAEAVCTDHDAVDVLDLVDRLVQKSLVIAEERPRGMRYRLLETVRQYALDQLMQADELIDARDAHLAWVASLARDIEATAFFGGAESQSLDRLDDEDANLRTAFEWALERGAAGTATWIVFGAFAWLTSRGRAREGLDLTRRALQADLDENDAALAHMLVLMFESNIGPISPASVETARDNAALLGRSRQPALAALTPAYTTASSYPSGDAAAAAAAIEPCRAAVDELRAYGTALTVWGLQPLTWVNLDAGRLDDARAAADEGLAAVASQDWGMRESRMALNRARIAWAEGDLDGAWRYSERSAAAARRTGETFVAMVATQLLADVAERRGDTSLARDLLVSILDAVEESQPPSTVAALRERIAGYG